MVQCSETRQRKMIFLTLRSSFRTHPNVASHKKDITTPIWDGYVPTPIWHGFMNVETDCRYHAGKNKRIPVYSQVEINCIIRIQAQYITTRTMVLTSHAKCRMTRLTRRSPERRPIRISNIWLSINADPINDNMPSGKNPSGNCKLWCIQMFWPYSTTSIQYPSLLSRGSS